MTCLMVLPRPCSARTSIKQLEQRTHSRLVQLGYAFFSSYVSPRRLLNFYVRRSTAHTLNANVPVCGYKQSSMCRELGEYALYKQVWSEFYSDIQ
jgi:hypothetical protein